MSCSCKIGGGPAGVCDFHRSESARKRKEKYDAAKEKWIIEQICSIAKELNLSLAPFPKRED